MTSLTVHSQRLLRSTSRVKLRPAIGTPTEYIRELIRQDKERCLANLEQELLAAAKGPKIEVSLTKLRKKGLIPALRDRVRRA
jgi:hypothetical protein